MLLGRFDVAAYGPQTMAFHVSRERIDTLRTTLRALYETGDLAPYQRLWNEVVPPYLVRRDEARWLVPAATVEHFCALVEERLGADVLEKLRPAVAQTRAWLAQKSVVRIRPETWFLGLEEQRSRIEGDLFLVFQTGHLSELLSGLPAERRGDEEPPPEVGNVDWLAAYRAQLEGRSAGNVAASPIPEWVEEPDDALDEVHRRLNLGVLLEALVGPFQMSLGPGPFMGAPASSRPLEDPSWHWLRAEGAIQVVGRVGDARVLEGAALTEALRETERATPNRDWWFPDGDLTRALFDESYGNGHHAAWLSWQEVQRDWPRCRARFLALLAEAIAKDAGVLLVSAEINSQGHGTIRPVGLADGVLA